MFLASCMNILQFELNANSGISRTMKFSNSTGIFFVMVALALAAGCGQKDKEEKKTAATQVAAKVNSTEITVSQINTALSRNPNIAPEAAERAKREILNRLIDAELAKEEAVVKKLDRSPNVVQALEAAKTEILARAYLEQVAAAQPKPTPEEIKKYFVEHPELFTQRRVFNIEELTVQAKEGLGDKLREQAAKARSLQEIAAWLKSQGIQFVANSGVRAAEQLPLAYLPQIQAMKDGEMRVFETGNLQVLRIAASKAAPVTEPQATPRIQQYLFSQRSNEAVVKDMKQLKDKAKIEYVGEFAVSAAEAQEKAKAAAEAKANAKADAKAKAAAEAQAKEDQIAKARRDAEAKDKAEAEVRAKDEEAARARRAAEAKTREAESKKAEQSKSAQPLTPEIEKGVRGIIR
jgi:EpsD family peptidyl-prolyl cis-trans isomerase